MKKIVFILTFILAGFVATNAQTKPNAPKEAKKATEAQPGDANAGTPQPQIVKPVEVKSTEASNNTNSGSEAKTEKSCSKSKESCSKGDSKACCKNKTEASSNSGKSCCKNKSNNSSCEKKDETKSESDAKPEEVKPAETPKQ